MEPCPVLHRKERLKEEAERVGAKGCGKDGERTHREGCQQGCDSSLRTRKGRRGQGTNGGG
eukprot:1379563-Pleurochrysis_carterae.AAC.1